jgi:protein SCO1
MKTRRTFNRRLCLASLAALLAAGCGREALPVLNVGGDFALTDQDGTQFELSSLRGKAVLIFFGYTSCPDVCPTTMSKLASVYRELGPDAARVQTVYISVDTQRDTPAVLKEYLTNFKSVSAIGLTGTVSEIDKVTALFGALYRITLLLDTSGSEETYTVGHTTSVYALDPNGRTRLIFPYEATVAEITKGIRQTLQTEPAAALPGIKRHDFAAVASAWGNGFFSRLMALNFTSAIGGSLQETAP